MTHDPELEQLRAALARSDLTLHEPGRWGYCVSAPGRRWYFNDVQGLAEFAAKPPKKNARTKRAQGFSNADRFYRRAP